jgi:hypothetical protein
MIMKINPAIAVIPNMIALLNDRYPTKSFTAQQVTFGTPSAWTDPTGKNNTQIPITAVKNKGYSGTATINYKRLTIPQVYPTLATSWPVAPLDTIAVVTARITAALSTLSTELTINGGVALTLPTISNRSITVAITVVTGSKIIIPAATLSITLVYTPPIVTVTYSTSGNNLNTLTMLSNPTAVCDYRLTISGTIGSTSTATPALTVGVLPAGSLMTIILTGRIQGAGGAGGAYTAAGGSGGTAIKALMAFSIDTSAGLIYGGGGGGGGCAQSWNGLAGLGAGYLRAAGGGGSGNAVGIIGTGTAVQTAGTVISQPVAGTAAAGGAGAVTRNTGNTSQYSYGGAGGAPGVAGTAGVATYGTAGTSTLTNFAGGAAGKAIDFNSQTVTISAGNNSTQIKGIAA